MNERDLDTTIGDWLEDGPSRMPAVARQRMLNPILDTPQAGRWRRVVPFAPTALVAASVSACGLILAVLLGVSTPTAEPGAGGSVRSSQTAGDASTRREISPAAFLAGFEYEMPRGEIVVDVLSRHLVEYDTGEYAVRVWVVEDVPLDPCDWSSLRRPISGVDEFVSYVGAMQGVGVAQAADRRVGGIAARDLRLTSAPDRRCWTIGYLNDVLSGTTATAGSGGETRLTILEVDEHLVVFEALSARGLDTWLPEVDAFLASIDFLPPR